MNIIFLTTDSQIKNNGGDMIQLYETKKALERLYGYNISIIGNTKDLKFYLKNKKIDLIHIFGSQLFECEEYIDIGKKYGKKVVLSTIERDLRYGAIADFLLKIGIFRKIKIVYKLLLLTRKFKDIFFFKTLKRKRKCFYLPDALLPNSYEELDKICTVYGISKQRVINKTYVVSNAANKSFLNMGILTDKELMYDNNNYKNAIIQVGRIEPTKNQDTVIWALMKEKESPLFFIGKQSNIRYYRYCKKIAKKRGNTFFIDEISQEDLKYFYHNAKVHILPSLRESPGLVSIEAFLSGCDIVVSDKNFCPIHYYGFDKIGFVCDPLNKNDILDKIKHALISTKNTIPIRNGLIEQFSWNNVAKDTYIAYQNVLKLH